MPHWLIHSHLHDLSRRGLIMGIVNVTPDSFSDGGQFFDAKKAIQHGLDMVAEGAGILDVGGESTRPGAAPVSEEEELRRVLPVIRGLRAMTKTTISIDTFKSTVAERALAAGADIINDVSGLTHDPRMIEVAAASSCGLVVMHMKGRPQTMQLNPVYEDVVAEVADCFVERVATLAAAGIDHRRIALDPGIGFGKNLDHNLALLRSLPHFRGLGRPLLIGASRKSMIGKVLGSPGLAGSTWPTVAITSYAREHGAQVIRVHEVKPNLDAMRMTEAILFGAD